MLLTYGLNSEFSRCLTPRMSERLADINVSRNAMILTTCCVVLSLVPVSFGADTIYFAESGTGATTIQANWNGTGYDDVHVVVWAHDPGDEDDTEIRAYQVAIYDPVPLPGATGDVTWVEGTLTIEWDQPGWLHDGAGTRFEAIAGDRPGYAMAMSALLMRPSGVDLDDTPRMLAEVTFHISPDAAGTWIVKPYCAPGDACATGPNCVRSGGSCTVDSDCPRYAVLGDLTDTCDQDGIDVDDGTILIDDSDGIPYNVGTLQIVVGMGRCCEGLVCHNHLSEQECLGIGGEFDASHTCAEGCGCGDGIISSTEGEQCDDGNLIEGDGCDHHCMEEICGNNLLQHGAGEECDDGNTLDGDGCTATCMYPETPCATDLDCVFAHNSACDWDDCDEVAGICRPVHGNIYGDVCGADFPLPPNGAVNLTDVLCTLNAFGLGNMVNCPNADVVSAGSTNCPGGNGIVNLTDILKVLNALGAPTSPTATYFCDCPLNP